MCHKSEKALDIMFEPQSLPKYKKRKMQILPSFLLLKVEHCQPFLPLCSLPNQPLYMNRAKNFTLKESNISGKRVVNL